MQIFITDRCNLRCPECFYSGRLGAKEMELSEYKLHVLKYFPVIKKVVLLGGEPTLHKNILEMIEFNACLGLKTTIYTNGFRVKELEAVMKNSDLAKLISVRIGVHGLKESNKSLISIPKTNLPVTIVYMAAQYNKLELLEAAYFAENNFNCLGFFISSIREIEKSGSYWNDTSRTIPISQYAQLVQTFINNYAGNIKRLHFSTRGVIITKNQDFSDVTRCRFGSIMRDGAKIISPMDISINKTSRELTFNQQPCSRHHKCVLQKVVLEKI